MFTYGRWVMLFVLLYVMLRNWSYLMMRVLHNIIMNYHHQVFHSVLYYSPFISDLGEIEPVSVSWFLLLPFYITFFNFHKHKYKYKHKYIKHMLMAK